MKDNYSYPIDPEWRTEEIVAVMNMLQIVEDAYEVGVDSTQIMATYKEFKLVIRSIGEEKQIGKDFEEASGYSLYRTIQAAKAKTSGRLKMKGA